MIAGLDWPVALAAAGVTWFVQWLLHPLAPRLNLLDFPKGRKDHAHPTPITGGLAMLAGVLALGFSSVVSMDIATFAFLTASTLLVVVGLLDDMHDLSWTVRIPVQVVAALIMVYVGGVQVEQIGSVFGLGELSLGALSVPFTVFATVGLINAINMIDGADGLAGSLVLTALIMLTAAGLYSGNEDVANRALLMGGVVAAFLSYNLRFPWQDKAKIFMGNAGSAFLGFVIAWLAFRLTQSAAHPVNPVLALWMVMVPVMDCLVLMIRRIRVRQSPFIADRNHMHHMMIDAGFGPTRSAVVLSLITGLCGLAVGQAMRLNVPNPLLLALFVVMCLGWYWISGRRERAVGFFRKLWRLTAIVVPPRQPRMKPVKLDPLP